MLDFTYMWQCVQPVASGAVNTILVGIVSCFFATLFGIVFELGRRYLRYVGWLINFFIDILRSTPLLVQIYFLYFVLPDIGIVLPAYVVGVLALSFYFSAYLAEVFKSGINSISQGELEAAEAFGVSRLNTILYIIIPQMFRAVVAPVGNYYVSLLKSTPYLAIVAVHDILGAALDIGSDTFKYSEPIIVAGIIFLIVSLVISFLIGRAERWLLKSRT